MVDKEEIHPGGYFKLMRVLERRQRPFDDLDPFLAPADLDLVAAREALVDAPTLTPDDCPKYSAKAKWVELQAEFAGQPQLYLWHAMMIAVSRRRDPPPQALALFFRIWSEMGTDLARELPVRWLISASTTFADCGQNADQRALGMGLSTLFDLIKLHESERRITGKPSNEPFNRTPGVRRAAMPFRMEPYSLKGGDLDRVLLSRLWQLSEKDTTIRPLAMRMLWMVMSDRRTVFGRVEKFKPRKQP